MTVELDLECTRGDTCSWMITFLIQDVPTDLTGADMWMTGRRGPGGTLIFQRTIGSGVTIDPDQVTNPGKAIIKLAPTSTSGLAAEPVTLFYDIQVLIDGDIFTISKGKLLVTPDSTLETE